MARNQAITCDICVRVKGETNHWWIAVSDSADQRCVAFAPAELAPAAPGDVLIEDICGADCAHKRLQRALDAMKAQPENEETHGTQTV